MKGWMPAAGVLLVAAGVALWIFERDRPQLKAPATVQPLPVSAPAVPAEPPLSETAATPAANEPTPASPPPAAPEWARRFATAADHHDFIESVFPAARKGDAKAQFYLSEALLYCDRGYRVYFDHRNAPGRRTLDEALYRIRNREPWETEEAKRVHARCHRFQERRDRGQFGSAPEWLVRAAEGGNPMALARRAGALYTELVVREGVTPADTEKLASLRSLGRSALQSREPGVLLELAATAAFLATSDHRDPHSWAWVLLGCQRGADCSPEVPWVQMACRYDLNCQMGESGVQFMQRALANEYPEIERLAAEVGANLDAGNWEALGFGE
jgi:hypothetical protein